MTHTDPMLLPITDHHDGGGLNERLRIERDARDPGVGGASHYYEVFVDLVPPTVDAADGWVAVSRPGPDGSMGPDSCPLCGETGVRVRLAGWIRCMACDATWGPGGPGDDPSPRVGFLRFQHGARHEPDSTPGLLDGTVVAVLLDRYRGFQSSPLACEDNARVIEHLEAALLNMQRVRLRQAQGVLGRNIAHEEPQP